jgi:hypothetical protein
MWGKERGFIPVNQKTNFGNVLPQSIRKFSFSWEGTPSITDIGRYKAVATLSYGIDEKESVYRTVYFWVIPVKASLITLGFIVLFAGFIFLSIRLYVRRVLDMAGVPRQALPQETKREVQVARSIKQAPRVTRTQMVAPLRAGVLDLRRAVGRAPQVTQEPLSIGMYISRYKTFFAALGIGMLGIALIVWYVMDAREASRPYEVTVHHDSGDTTLQGTEVTKERTRSDVTPTSSESTQTRTRVSLVNASGVPGAAGVFVSKLEKEGYAIGDISTDADTRQGSVIVCNVSAVADAKAISELWDDIPLSVRPVGEEAEPEILLIIGTDRAQ